MKIVHRVQHVAGRDAPLQRLTGLLGACEIITDHEPDDPNPFRNYRRCLADTGDATHIVIVQDDCVPCANFKERVEALVAERPDDMLSLFVGGLTGKTKKDFLAAHARREQWSPVWLRDIHHVVALVWPVAYAAAFLSFIETARIPGGTMPRSDDAAVGYWARNRKVTFWACVPCLVEHPDDVPSTIHRRSRSGDMGRRAIAWLGDDLPQR